MSIDMKLEKEKGETTMKRKLVNVIALLIVSMLIVSILPAYAGFPTNPTPSTSIWIEPAIIPSTSTTFIVTVWINTSGSGRGTGAWQFRLLYDDSELTRTGYGVDEDYFFANVTPRVGLTYSFGVGKFEVSDSGQFDSELGYVTNRTQGYGTLQWIEFEMDAAIPKGGEIAGTLDLDISNCFVIDVDTSADFLDNVYDATYDFDWEEPPSPTLMVDSASFDKYVNHTGETFEIDVWIDDLDGNWWLHNASVTICFDTTLINTTDSDVVVDSDWGTSSVTVLHGDPDNVTIFVKDYTSPPPSGDIPIATITFTVVYQGVYPDVDVSPLSFCDYLLYDTTMEIPTEIVNGEVEIEGLLPLPLPWLEVVPEDTVFGPAPSIGTEFTVDIQIKNLHFAWNLVALQFRMSYCPDLMEFLYAEEGPYFPMFPQPRPSNETTWSGFWDEPNGYGPHILGVDFILPVDGGIYIINENHTLPGGEPPEDGTIATLHFKVIKQDANCYGEPTDYFCELNLFDILLLDMNGTEVPADIPQNGTYTILGQDIAERKIDVYTQYPAPFGGQYYNQWSDMFWPQKEVILCANVTYNCWPVQQKIVNFAVYDPSGYIWTVLEGITDEYGVACASFRIPWPCDDPESLFGTWTITADVDIACEVVMDTLWFHFDYLIHIGETDVTTDKYEYAHCEDVEVTVTFTSYARQVYQAAMWVTIFDELNVPVARQLNFFTVGGEDVEVCTPKTYIEEFTLHIEKFAFAGLATVTAVPRMYWNGEWVAAGPAGSTEIFILAE
jgi:hypothetical protein